MPILYQYIIKQILKYFSMLLVMVISIYLSVDFFEKIDDFLEAGLPVYKAVIFFLYKTPFILSQMAPVGVLLSVIITFGLMNKNNEIVALKSSGISVRYLLKPLVFLGILFSMFLFFVSEVVVPITMNIANQIWYTDVRHEKAYTSREKNIWIRSRDIISHITYIHPINENIFGVTINYFDDNFNLCRRIDARQGVYEQGAWILFDVMEQKLSDASQEELLHNAHVDFFDRKKQDLPFTPEDIRGVIKKTEEMNITDLYDYIQKVEKEGYDATKYRIDLHSKVAFPFACILMCIIGLGLTARIQSKENLSLSVAYGLGVVFSYWILQSFCVSLGNGRLLPPILSVWITNVIYSCLGVITLLKAD